MSGGLLRSGVDTTAAAVAAPSRRGGGCLECLQDVVQTLSMGSCLMVEERPAATAMAGHGGKAGDGRRREEEALGRIAGSGVGNAACLFTRQGRKGANQDAMVVWEVYTCSPPLRSPFGFRNAFTISFPFYLTMLEVTGCDK